MALSPEAYARSLKELLPPGNLWDFGGRLSQALLALADSISRVDGRGDALIAESDPRTATETVADWERMLALPDEAVTVIPATLAERRLAITQKLIRQGGQTPALYIALAAAAGYTVTIKEDYGATIFRTGKSRTGDRLYGEDWAHVWSLNVSTPTGPALSQATLEAIIQRAKPAHTVVLFIYV